MPGLYVHIPFCVRKCYYCDFYSEAGKLHLLDDYLKALLKEAEQHRGLTFDTLYIGGGTPSLLGAAALELMVRGLSDCLGLSDLEEATVEVNPDTASSEFLGAAATCGISRLSIGVQSLNDDELTRSGRLHNAAQALKAMDIASGCGFDDISADIIVGLPGQTPQSLEKTLCGLSNSAVTHISAYCLSIEQGTEFARHPPPDLTNDEEQAELFEFAARYLKENGFMHYEISNFALPGRECRHNLNYWRGGEYLGLGAGAASHLRGRRFKNAPDLQKYILGPLADECESEILGVESKLAEEAMLRLRLLEEGLDIAELEERYGRNNVGRLLARLTKLTDAGMLVREGTRYRLPSPMVMVSNRVFTEIIN
ncbi:MAG: radical SAM family heme chaperone HemW [Chloroflexi bacterium]|nr:radical SAM family heme chaperone HemW [Chloroflexota bacterium]